MSHLQLILFIIASLILGCSKEDKTINRGIEIESSEGSSCANWAEFRVNEFLLSNNVWGKGTEPDYEQCIYYETNNNQTEIGWNWIGPETGM